MLVPALGGPERELVAWQGGHRVGMNAALGPSWGSGWPLAGGGWEGFDGKEAAAVVAVVAVEAVLVAVAVVVCPNALTTSISAQMMPIHFESIGCYSLSARRPPGAVGLNYGRDEMIFAPLMVRFVAGFKSRRPVSWPLRDASLAFWRAVPNHR